MKPESVETFQRGLDGARILIVEDDFLLLLDLEMTLADAGAEITDRCRSIPEAVAAARVADIHAAILDVQLGGQIITPVAEELAKRRVPFLFYTGQTENDPMLSALRGNRVLSKPVSANALITAVKGLLKPQSSEQPFPRQLEA